MKNEKKQTFIYKGLGFPVRLVNASMKKMFGEWYVDIDMNKLRLIVLESLIHKSGSLTGEELRFIRKYLEMSMTVFGKLIGVSHVAVVKWEDEQNRISPALELYIRLYVLNHLHAKDEDFRALYNMISLGDLSKSRKRKARLLVIDATEELKIA